MIDIRKNVHLEEGMTLEEGSVPGPIKSIMVPTLVTLSKLIGKDTDRGFKDFLLPANGNMVLVSGTHPFKVVNVQAR